MNETRRYNIEITDPQSFAALLKLEDFLKSFTWMKAFTSLIKIRASQLNQCAFCINMHTNDALANGESINRIALLNAWTNTAVFSEKEKVVLALTDALSLSVPYVNDDLYNKLTEYFDEKKISQIVMAIGMINFWNRVIIASGVLIHNR